ncbi:MAG: TetR/AcrR family transcriptional regulator [Lachnospiraceae bacterium]|nr:TetR/AcrR family transcriptional regulator [Lachnospiraceae bacterium]MDD7023575.1 TetR/AcrR family transcriptional regulator [Oscillospiraceae bacterium]
MGAKTEQNKQQKRTALLNSAFSLFSIKGLQKTSVSDIVEEAGVAKGTFYLYFRDKNDIRNKLISHKASQLFLAAWEELNRTDLVSFEEQILFMADYILDCLNQDKSLLTFLSKHLSWGVFKNSLTEQESNAPDSVYDLFVQMLENSGHVFRDPEIMIYLIVETVSGSSYNPILYGQPASLEEMKPHIFELVRHIIKEHYA